MTEAERSAAAYLDAHNREWTAWLARPIAERQAIQDKVRATLQTHGDQASRDVMKANGMPTLPADLQSCVTRP